MQHRQLVHKFVLSQSLLLQVPHVGQLLHHLLHPVRPHSLHTGQINRSHIPHQVQLPQDQPKVRVCAVLSISVAGLGRRRGNRTERAGGGGGGGGGGWRCCGLNFFFGRTILKCFQPWPRCSTYVSTVSTQTQCVSSFSIETRFDFTNLSIKFWYVSTSSTEIRFERYYLSRFKKFLTILLRSNFLIFLKQTLTETEFLNNDKWGIFTKKVPRDFSISQ